MFDVPILILAFNRPKETQQVFERVRSIKPKYLFVGIDGPRETNADDNELCKMVQDVFLHQIDWDCEIKTLFRKQNLGCRKAVSSAIDWFFNQVEYGIILEDDCIPNLSFFDYCKVLLEKYKDNPNVMHIAGYNYFGHFSRLNKSYIFSRSALIWGWATWRRSWQKMDVDMKDYPDYKSGNSVKDYVKNVLAQKYILQKWDETYHKINNSWAYAWMYCVVNNKGLCIVPQKNMISNIGFNENATHTKQQSTLTKEIKSHKLNFPLHHPVLCEWGELNEKQELQIFYADHKSKWRLIIWYFIPKGMRSFLSKLSGLK